MDGRPPDVEIVPIVAVARGRVIGRANGLPWRLSEDLQRFKALTTGHPIVMGRKTFESIGRALPDRLNIVVTRNPNFESPSPLVCTRSLHEAIEIGSRQGRVIFIIGGAEIYAQALPLANRIELTLIATDVAGGDAFFPPLGNEWHGSMGPQLTSQQNSLEGRPLAFSFATLTRREANDDCDLCRIRAGRFGPPTGAALSETEAVADVLRAIASARA